MRTEVRFLVALTMMMGVLVGTNVLFPPVVEEEPAVVDAPASSATDSAGEGEGEAESGLLGGTAPSALPQTEATIQSTPEPEPAEVAEVEEREVLVESPLYSITVSNKGGTVQSVLLHQFQSFAQAGVVEMIPEGGSLLGGHLLAGTDTLDLSTLTFAVSPEDGIQLREGDGPETLTLRYDHPNGSFFAELRYTFSPDRYLVGVEAEFPRGLNQSALLIDLGNGLAFNEVDTGTEETMMAFSANTVQEGIQSRPLTRTDEPRLVAGPLYWAAVKSKFFVAAVLRDSSSTGGEFLGSFAAVPGEVGGRPDMSIGMAVGNDGETAYQAYLGPIERERLVALGDEFQDVNPYGWRFFRPIIKPFVGLVLWILDYLHDTLNVSYGWVLVIFGVAMRVLLWPLNQKAMRSQIKNMAVQPLMQEIQKKYKHDQERLQKEMMKLYKEHGFNPLGGCLPLLIPWPVLIALFFVFQNTIQLRGESFWWLPDLSAPDPLYALPILMALSMFLIQLISARSIEQTNPQMKIMMYAMPVMFGFFFFKLAAGLNLYYMTSNVATLPQQWLIAKERKAARDKAPLKLSDDDEVEEKPANSGGNSKPAGTGRRRESRKRRRGNK